MPKRKVIPQVIETPEPTEAPLEQPSALHTLAMVELGSIFVFNGERFRLERIADCAHVILLERSIIKVSSDETREIEYGIARLEMPLDTPVTI